MDSSTFDSHKVCEAIWADTCSAAAAAATGLLLRSSVELREPLAAAAADVSSAVPFLTPTPVCAAAVGGQSERCVLNPSSLPTPSCTCWISSISWQYMAKKHKWRMGGWVHHHHHVWQDKGKNAKGRVLLTHLRCGLSEMTTTMRSPILQHARGWMCLTYYQRKIGEVLGCDP